MKVLLSSYSFAPAVGGIETVSRILASEFVRLGCDVTIVTWTPGDSVNSGYRVVRRPSQCQLWNLTRECDILFQNHISLNSIFPALLLRKPIAITFQTWLSWDGANVDWSVRLKRFLMRRCRSIAISHAVARYLPAGSPVIFNPYEDSDFNCFRATPKTLDIVYMGRLVENKGVDVLLQAVSLLKESGTAPSITVIGDGPERTRLETMSNQLNIHHQVRFLGNLSGTKRGEEVSKHKIMVVPSRWPEPFGIVALEGIASGCAVVGSADGGLGDAIGPCGLLFPNRDAESLCATLKRLLDDDTLRQKCVDAGPAHLAGYQPSTVAKRYLQEFEKILLSVS